MSIWDVPIGRRGCAALGARLLNSRSNLLALELIRVEMEDDVVIIFANGLSNNSSLKELTLGRSEITELGWQAIFAALQRSSCRLEKLDVNGNNINDDLSHSLSGALLRHNATIKALHLGNHMQEDDVRNANWSALFRPLQDNTSALEKLNLNSDSITNEGVDALTNVLVNNSRLRELEIRYNKNVTAMRWVASSSVLRNPSSALEKLDLRANSINDHVMVSFADAMANSSKLIECIFHRDICHVTSIGFAAFTHILCNISSILTTYRTNHTLDKLCYWEEFPEDVTFLLKLNQECTESQAARLKIIMVHFSGCEINMQPFMDMDLCVHGCSSAKSDSSARAFDMSQREYLRLGALLQNLTNNWVVHVIGVRDNVVPRVFVLLDLRLDFFLDINRQVLLQ